LQSRSRRYGLYVSDKATDLIARERLDHLIVASTHPEINPHTIPRVLVSRDPVRLGAGDPAEELDDSVSPLAVLLLLGALLALFVGIVQL
jgi:hypothetical protein